MQLDEYGTQDIYTTIQSLDIKINGNNVHFYDTGAFEQNFPGKSGGNINNREFYSYLLVTGNISSIDFSEKNNTTINGFYIKNRYYVNDIGHKNLIEYINHVLSEDGIANITMGVNNDINHLISLSIRKPPKKYSSDRTITIKNNQEWQDYFSPGFYNGKYYNMNPNGKALKGLDQNSKIIIDIQGEVTYPISNTVFDLTDYIDLNNINNILKEGTNFHSFLKYDANNCTVKKKAR